MQDKKAAGHPTTTTVPLVPHPGAPPLAHALVVRVRRETETLALRYVLGVDTSRLRVPPPGPPRRSDGLWRRTCFELFVCAEGGAGYEEFNFSPSGEWAAYRFTGYRSEATALDCVPPTIVLRAGEQGLELTVALLCARRGRLRLGLSAVLEDAQERLSYWALRHPGAAPDFHHPEGFALELDEVRN